MIYLQVNTIISVISVPLWIASPHLWTFKFTFPWHFFVENSIQQFNTLFPLHGCSLVTAMVVIWPFQKWPWTCCVCSTVCMCCFTVFDLLWSLQVIYFFFCRISILVKTNIINSRSFGTCYVGWLSFIIINKRLFRNVFWFVVLIGRVWLADGIALVRLFVTDEDLQHKRSWILVNRFPAPEWIIFLWTVINTTDAFYCFIKKIHPRNPIYNIKEVEFLWTGFLLLSE